MNVTMNFSDAASQIALKDAVRQVLRDELEARSVKAPPD
jgi:hypothetical protein